MKAQELMTGDWVRLPLFERNAKVIRVGQSVIDTDIVYPVLEKAFEPIPLTPEILEANGYEIRTWNESYSKGYENKHSICPFFIEYMFVNQCLFVNEGLVPTPVYYVHQLQHALRLCGLNDEADNFKLEGDKQ